jgi:hypothetical protein
MAEHIHQVVAMSKPNAYRGDGDVADIRYIPSRTLAGIHRQEGALFVLPDFADVREYATQLDQIRTKLMVRGIAEPDLVYIPQVDEILDISIQQQIELLESRLDPSIPHRVRPYSHTPENEAWMQNLRLKGIDIDANIALKKEDLQSLDNRGGWGRHVWDPDFVPVPEQAHIPYPASWIGRTADEAVEAYLRVAETTRDPRVQIKGVFSAGGFVNGTVRTPEEAERAYVEFLQRGALGQTGAVEMQGFIPDLDSKNGIFSVQYSTTANGVHIIDTPGGISSQIMDEKNEWIGNRFNDPRLIATHSANAHSLFGEMAQVLNGSVAKGGIDIGATRTTESGLVVIEHNAKRMTGAHPAVELMDALGVPREMPAVSKKCELTITCDLATLWDVLESTGNSFDPVTKTGIFPICWMNGHYGMLMAFGPVESTDILEHQIDQIYNHLAQIGLAT